MRGLLSLPCTRITAARRAMGRRPPSALGMKAIFVMKELGQSAFASMAMMRSTGASMPWSSMRLNSQGRKLSKLDPD
eukprot:3531145-Pyramimonas_sp.AAC.1